MIQVDLQGMIGTIPFRKVGPRVRYGCIGLGRGRNIVSSGRDRRAGNARRKIIGISYRAWSRGADYRKGLVGVDADDFMVSVGADISYGQGRIGRQLLLDAKRPA